MIRAALLAACVFGLAACSKDDSPDAPVPEADGGAAQTSFSTPLPEIFDCVRKEGGILLAAHRGGPKPGFPENTLEAMQAAYSDGIRVFEVDVATSSDGFLFLMHDDTLGRTTTSRSDIETTSWKTISNLATKDFNGRVTRINPPLLSTVLIWARDNGAIVEIDQKSTTSWTDILDIVEMTGSENHVVLITYNHADAEFIHQRAPNLMMSVGLVDNRLPRGLDPELVLAWTGTRSPSPRFWRSLRSRGIEPVFGTLGRPEQRLDDIYLADGDPSEFEEMIDNGLVMLATDRASELAALLTEDDQAIEACLN